MVLLIAAACQSAQSPAMDDPLPTVMVLPADGDVPSPIEGEDASFATPLVIPTQRAIRDLPTPLPTSTAHPPTLSPTQAAEAFTPSPSPLGSAEQTIVVSGTDAIHGVPTTSTPDVTLTQPPLLITQDSRLNAFTFGNSVEGRDLIGYRLGSGERVLMLVGAVHGGFEANSAELIERLTAHFHDNPGDLLPQITLILIPALNPDGLARGRVLDGRFNANGVDLNRNWACGWSSLAYFRDQTVSAGPEPLSEPETRALSSLILAEQPAAVLFYHAAAAGVFAGDCGGAVGSAALGETYGRAAEYDYSSAFSRYPVTGTAPAWVNSIGIPAADVELSSADDPQFDRNLRGVMAVQCWLAPGESRCL